MHVKPLIVLAALFLASCSGSGSGNDGSEAGSGKIVIDGSSTVYPVSEGIAEEYNKVQPDLRVTIGVSGTGGGFKKFGSGEIDICNASRPIKNSEIEACLANGIRFIELPVAYDGLAVITHPDNTWVESLTTAELKMVWESAAQGKITNWNQVRPGFPDKKIILFGPGTDSGTFEYFTEAIVGKKGDSRGDYTPSEDDNILVQGVSSDPGSLGYMGLAYYIENKDKVKIIPIDDGDEANGSGAVLPSIETVQNGTYSPLSRALYIYVTDSAVSRQATFDFVSYYIDHAGEMARETGYVPLPDAFYPLVKKRLESKIYGSMYQDGSEIGTNLYDLLNQSH